MKLSELQKIVDHCCKYNIHDDPEVVIRIKLPFHTIGGTPCVQISSAVNGFDWDKGKFILTPEENLTKNDAQFEKQFKELHDKWSWSQYENNNLKTEIKKLRKQLK